MLAPVLALAVAATGSPAPARGATSSPPVFLRTIGGPAHAEMYPSGLDVDAAGTIYVADTGNDQVAAYSAAGTLLWRIGTRGSRAPGSFSNPRDVAFADGKLYVADTDHARVQVVDVATRAATVWPLRFKAVMGVGAGVDDAGRRVVLVAESGTSTIKVYSPAGVLQRTIGSGFGSGDGFLNQARDAATDGAGNVYVADFKNQRVVKFAADGTFLAKWGTPGTGDGQFRDPYGIVLDRAGDVYVSDNNRIQRFRPPTATTPAVFVAGYGSRGHGDDQFFQLRRVAVGRGATPPVYGADLWGMKILQFAPDGSLVRRLFGDRPRGNGFNEPYGLSVTPNGNTMFTTDVNNQRMQQWNAATGAFVATWGHRGFFGDLDGVNWPRDVTYSKALQRVWVADTKNFRLLQYRPDEATGSWVPTSAVLGASGSAATQLNWPYGIAYAGNLLVVADTYNNRVQLWDPANTTAPVVWTAVGFRNPMAVYVAAGRVFVADSLNTRVVQLRLSDGARLMTYGPTISTTKTLHRVEGVAVMDGRMWVADTGANRLVELNPVTGRLLQTFGGTGSGPGTFNRPTHLALRKVVTSTSTTYELFVVDSFNDRVQVFRVR